MRINKRIVVFIIIAVIFTGLFLRYSLRAPKRHYSDFRVYYATGARFIAKENIYARPEESITPYKYSPTFAMLVSPLSFFSQKHASLIFFTINFILLIAVFILSGRLIVRNKIPFKQSVILYTLSALCSLRFILHVLDSGQVTIVMFALLLLGLHFLQKGKASAGAASIGLSAIVKYMPAVFLPYFLFKKKAKIVVYILLFIFICCLVPAIYVGADKGIDYVKGWIPFISKTSFDRSSLYDYKNHSLSALSLRYFTKASPYSVSLASLTFNQGLFVAIIAGFIIYLFIIYPWPGNESNAPLDYALLFIFMAILNPNSWMHNFVIFIFVYMTLLYYLMKTGFKDILTLILTVLSFALTSLTSELFVGDGLEKIFEEFSCVTIGALILMFALFRVKFNEARTYVDRRTT